MKYVSAIICCLAFSTTACNAQKYQDHSFFSNAFQTERSYRIYLPKGYQVHLDKNYPVIYYFHGWGGRYKWDGYDVEDDVNHPANGRQEPPFIMEWYDYSQRNDVIIVTWDGYEPNRHPGRKSREGLDYGSSRPYDCVMAHETEDHHWGWDYRLYFRDLVQHIDGTYRTISDRNHRGVTGLSMGGQTSLFISGQNKDLVSSVSAFDPADNYSKYGPKGFQVPFPNLALYRSLQGIPVRLTMTDGDWLKYNDWKLKEILSAAYPDKFDFHLADYPNHWAADIDKQLDFHMNCFQNPSPLPQEWNHICPAFPSFSVFDHHLKVDRSMPAHTIVEKSSPHRMKILSRSFIPDGPIIQNELVQVTSNPQYLAKKAYHLAFYNLSTHQMHTEEINADAEGRIHYSLQGGGHVIGINEKKSKSAPNLTIVFPGNSRYQYYERSQTYQLDFRIINIGSYDTKEIAIRAFSLDPEMRFSSDETATYDIKAARFIDVKNQFAFTMQEGSDSNYCSALYFEINVAGNPIDTFQQMIFPVSKSRYIQQEDLLILDGREVENVAIYEQGPNEIIYKSLSGGSGNGNGVLETGETAMLYVRLDKGLGPNDLHTFHRSYLLNAAEDRQIQIHTLNYMAKTSQAGSTSVATPVTVRSDCPSGHTLDLWLKVESLYNDQDDSTSNATIYAHHYDYRRVKIRINALE